MIKTGPIESLALTNGSSYELVVAQLQPHTNNILCVRDGSILLIYQGGYEIPPGIKRRNGKHYPDHHVTIYNYRSVADDSLYSFFHSTVDSWLSNGRMGSLSLNHAVMPIQQLPTNLVWPKAETPKKEVIQDTRSCGLQLLGRVVNITIDKSCKRVTTTVNMNQDSAL